MTVCSVIYTPFNSISITIKRGVVSLLSHRSEDSMLSSKMPRSYLGSGSTKTLHPQCMLGYQHQTTLHSQHCHLYARDLQISALCHQLQPGGHGISQPLSSCLGQHTRPPPRPHSHSTTLPRIHNLTPIHALIVGIIFFIHLV